MANRSQWILGASWAIFATALVGHPLFVDALISGHSAYVDLIRAVSWHDLVEQGELFPGWIPHFYFGHGSPIFLFYAPASYVLIEAVRTFVAGPADSIRVAYLLLIFLSAFGMFRLGRLLGGLWGALASSALYVLAPYFLVDLYIRVGIAEFACFAVLPWAVASLLQAARTGASTSILGFSSLFALLALTHNITAMLAAPILLLFVLAFGGKRRVPLLAGYGAGLGMSAFFWLPALVEKDLVQSTESLTTNFYHFGNHFVSVKELIVPNWGWAPPGSGQGQMSLQIGLVLIAAVVTTIVLFAWRAKRLPVPIRFVFAALVAAFAICLLFTTSLSRPAWEHLPLLPFVQFPWRFLLLVTFTGCSIAAFLPGLATLERENTMQRAGIALVMVTLGIVGSFQYIGARYLLHDLDKNAPRSYNTLAEIRTAEKDPKLGRPEHLLTPENIRIMGATSTSRNDYLPRTVEKPPGRFYGFVVEPYGKPVELFDRYQSGSGFGFTYRSEVPVTVQCEPFYFPGWKARIGAMKLMPRPAPGSGWLLLDLPAGENTVKVRFGDSRIRVLGKAISLATLIVFGVWLTIRRGKGEDE
jgi:6-pyruvoyl-tetrahydropterin synthase related domain